MKNEKDVIKCLNKYCIKISRSSGLPEHIIEHVIHTQIAILLGDLAVSGNSELFFGDIRFDQNNNSIKTELNEFMKKIISNEIDPINLIRELINNI